MEFDLVGTDEDNVEIEDPFVGNFDSTRKGSIQDSSFSGEVSGRRLSELFGKWNHPIKN